MFHVVPERAHDLSRWRLFVAQEVKVSGVLDEVTFGTLVPVLQADQQVHCMCLQYMSITYLSAVSPVYRYGGSNTNRSPTPLPR